MTYSPHCDFTNRKKVIVVAPDATNQQFHSRWVRSTGSQKNVNICW